MMTEADDYHYWMRDVAPAVPQEEDTSTAGGKKDPFVPRDVLVLRLKRRLK